MGNYTFLAKNPRFCMQDRKVTIAGNDKKQTEPDTQKSKLQNNGQNSGETAVPRNNIVSFHGSMAQSHISHNNMEQHKYDLNKPQQ